MNAVNADGEAERDDDGRPVQPVRQRLRRHGDREADRHEVRHRVAQPARVDADRPAAGLVHALEQLGRGTTCSRPRTRRSRGSARSSRGGARRARAARGTRALPDADRAVCRRAMPTPTTIAPEITSTACQIRSSRIETSSCESSGFVSAKSSLPSRTSSTSRSMFGWIVAWIDAAEQDLHAEDDEQLRLRPAVQRRRVRVDEREHGEADADRRAATGTRR